MRLLCRSCAAAHDRRSEVRSAGEEFRNVPPPKAKSDPPKSWKGAEPVTLVRPLPRGCKTTLLREWLRIQCAASGDALSELAGDAGQVGFSTKPIDWENNKTGEIELVVPIRNGERRLMQIIGDEWDHLSGAMTLSIQWLDDQPGPWVSLQTEARFFTGGD